MQDDRSIEPLGQNDPHSGRGQYEATAAELIYLCAEHIEGGRFTPEQIQALDRWLDTNCLSDIPNIDAIVRVVDGIVADGLITDEHRSELYLAAEEILPSYLKDGAPSRHRELEEATVIEIEDRSAAAEQREADYAKARLRLEEDGTIAAIDLHFHIAGVLQNNRPNVIHQYAPPGAALLLIREPDDNNSPRTIAVHLNNGMRIGHVPERFARKIAPYLDSGYLHLASITNIFELGATGCRSAVVEGGLYVPGSSVSDAISQSTAILIRDRLIEIPGPSSKPSSQSKAAALVRAFWTKSPVWRAISARISLDSVLLALGLALILYAVSR